MENESNILDLTLDLERQNSALYEQNRKLRAALAKVAAHARKEHETLKRWASGLLGLALMLSALTFAGCQSFADAWFPEVAPPKKLEIDATSGRGVSIDLPSWSRSGDDAAAIGRGVDAYIEAVEREIGEPIPAMGLVVQFVEGERIEGVYSGYYWGAPVWRFGGLTLYPMRLIALTWRRSLFGSNPRSDEPWPVFPHELMHDRQHRAGRAISHDWDAIEKRGEALRPAVEVGGSWD